MLYSQVRNYHIKSGKPVYVTIMFYGILGINDYRQLINNLNKTKLASNFNFVR